MIPTVETSLNNSLLATRKVINPTTTKANTAISTAAAMTTNTTHQRHHASKSMSTLIRLREQRKTAQNDVCDGVQPSNTKDEGNQNMAVQKQDDDKIAVDDGDVQKETTITKVSSPLLSSPIDVRRFLDVSTKVSPENDNQLDLYAPLMPEEADEDQLAGFFIGLDDAMYAPLMPEEADEDQLAGFFTGLDVTFLQSEEEHEGCGTALVLAEEEKEEEEKDVFTASSALAATKTTLDVFYPASKRRKVSIEEEEQYYSSSSSSASHCSYYSNDIDDGDGSSNDHQADDIILRRKLGSRGIDFFHRNE